MVGPFCRTGVLKGPASPRTGLPQMPVHCHLRDLHVYFYGDTSQSQRGEHWLRSRGLQAAAAGSSRPSETEPLPPAAPTGWPPVQGLGRWKAEISQDAASPCLGRSHNWSPQGEWRIQEITNADDRLPGFWGGKLLL